MNTNAKTTSSLEPQDPRAYPQDPRRPQGMPQTSRAHITVETYDVTAADPEAPAAPQHVGENVFIRPRKL